MSGDGREDLSKLSIVCLDDGILCHRVKQDVLLKLLQIVHDAGADIAFPTRTLHLEGAGAPEGESP